MAKAVLKARLTYDTGSFLTRAVGINLESLDINNKQAQAEIDVNRIYYFTAHFVVNEAETDFTVQLIPPAGYRMRYPGYPIDASTTITWTAGKPYRDYFQRRRFYLEEVPA